MLITHMIEIYTYNKLKITQREFYIQIQRTYWQCINYVVDTQYSLLLADHLSITVTIGPPKRNHYIDGFTVLNVSHLSNVAAQPSGQSGGFERCSLRVHLT